MEAMLKNKKSPALLNKKNDFLFRKTIKNAGSVEGIGIHSGEKVKLFFHPMESGKGIVFYRKEQNDIFIPMTLDYVVDTSLAVTLGVEKTYIQTVEHLSFALFVLGITDILIEIQGGSEIPILDGSAKEFIDILESLEINEYPEEVKPIEIKEPMIVMDGNRYIAAIPSDHTIFSYTIDYPHPLLRNLSVQLDFNRGQFKNTVGQARTFGFLKDVKNLRKSGLGQGGNKDNVLIFTNTSTYNQRRFDKEALYHKLLDMIGDLAIIGRPIKGHLLGSRGGHALDIAFGKKVIQRYPIS